MYAIAFDLDTETLKKTYPTTSYGNAYTDIRKTLDSFGFSLQQGGVYFAKDSSVNSVTCFRAAIKLAKTYSWFAPSVRDIRMLRIEESNDLRPIIEDVLHN